MGRVLGLREPASYGPFAVLQFDNGATLDFVEDTGDITAQHYAFLVGEDDFDAIWDRLKAEGRQWWADPHKRRPGHINHQDGGRGLYWDGPDGHWLRDHHPPVRHRKLIEPTPTLTVSPLQMRPK